MIPLIPQFLLITLYSMKIFVFADFSLGEEEEHEKWTFWKMTISLFLFIMKIRKKQELQIIRKHQKINRK